MHVSTPTVMNIHEQKDLHGILRDAMPTHQPAAQDLSWTNSQPADPSLALVSKAEEQ